MPKLLAYLPCEKVVIEEESKNISVLSILELTLTTAESVSSALGCAKAVEAASARIATSVRIGPPPPAMMRLVAPGPQLC